MERAATTIKRLLVEQDQEIITTAEFKKVLKTGDPSSLRGQKIYISDEEMIDELYDIIYSNHGVDQSGEFGAQSIEDFGREYYIIVGQEGSNYFLGFSSKAPAKKKSTSKEGHEFEVSLPVSKYGDDEEAFDVAANAHDDALEVAEGILDELLGKDAAKVKLSNVTFLEFDSSNVSHANAYFSITAIGPQGVLDKFKKEYGSD